MGWFETYPDVVIGDEPADIIGIALDDAFAACKKEWPDFTVNQFMATVAFSSGHIAEDYVLMLVPMDPRP